MKVTHIHVYVVCKSKLVLLCRIIMLCGNPKLPQRWKRLAVARRNWYATTRTPKFYASHAADRWSLSAHRLKGASAFRPRCKSTSVTRSNIFSCCQYSFIRLFRFSSSWECILLEQNSQLWQIRSIAHNQTLLDLSDSERVCVHSRLLFLMNYVLKLCML